MTTIGIVRHGITDWNIQRIAQGSSDIPLNDTGRQQARAVAERLANEEPWHLIISSDLSRARETAEIIAAKLGLTVSHFDQRIREMAGGEIEGTTEEERIEKWGTNWREQVQGMEQPEDVAQRGRRFIEEITMKYPGKRILIVSHGGLIGITLRSLLPEHFEKTNLENTSITILENVESRWDCTLYNCTKHLTETVPEEIAEKIK